MLSQKATSVESSSSVKVKVPLLSEAELKEVVLKEGDEGEKSERS